MFGVWCLLFVMLWSVMLWEFDAEGEKLSRLVPKGSGTVRQSIGHLSYSNLSAPFLLYAALPSMQMAYWRWAVRRVRAVRFVVFVSEGNVVEVGDGDDWVDISGTILGTRNDSAN